MYQHAGSVSLSLCVLLHEHRHKYWNHEHIGIFLYINNLPKISQFKMPKMPKISQFF